MQMSAKLKYLHRALFRKIKSFRMFRWLFISCIYRKPIYHSEFIIKNSKCSSNLDESYWIGKIRQFAHVVDKGLHRADFSKGHGKSGYKAAKKALAHITSEEGLSNPLVRWAIIIINQYEEFNVGNITEIESQCEPSKINYDDLVNTIKTRRSIRDYKKKLVEDETIRQIADVLDWAPTSCHRQPGRIYASNDPAVVQKCIKLHVGASCFTEMYVPMFMTFCADARLYNMPNELSIPFIDVSLGVQNCLLAAHTLGISITPLIWSDQGTEHEKELRSILSIPKYFQIIVSGVGGYPEGGTRTPPRKSTELFLIGDH